ncbi:hypothetical protein ADEAN_000666700 [Angomonas deanei]|uniref:Uncharacterized protein n=1 Tax=Angomonas deanei TaxID=59799 RepID=A0A7G2CJP9_9TRYP|nr:hypothetical protein ADEAN_000666700 [Angomonas deanei]
MKQSVPNTPTGPYRTPVTSASRTPAQSGAVIFIREEGDPNFFPIRHGCSVTLQELAEEYNISSVLECDSDGRVPPRAVAYDSPSDVLHIGKHYVARRDANAESSRVTFRGKILVQEYELPTPECSRGMMMSSAQRNKENGGNATTIGQPDLKRPRPEEEGEKASATVLLDTTNRPVQGGEGKSSQGGTTTSFVPFTGDLHGDGKTAEVTLEDLHKLCAGWEEESRENEAKHRKAQEILESTRRVLFQNQ